MEICYKTEDGKIFESQEEAVEHEKRRAMAREIEEYLEERNSFRGSDVSDVVEWLLEGWTVTRKKTKETSIAAERGWT